VPIPEENTILGLQKEAPWMVWMKEFDTSPSVFCCKTFQCHLNHVSQLTAPATSEIYHYQHLCDKNGWTLNIWEHAGGISMTTWAFFSIASSCGQYKLLAKNRSG